MDATRLVGAMERCRRPTESVSLTAVDALECSLTAGHRRNEHTPHIALAHGAAALPYGTDPSSTQCEYPACYFTARPPIPAAFAALLCQSCRHGAHPSYWQMGAVRCGPMRTAHCTDRTPTRVESTGPDPPRVGPAGHSAINGLARSAATAQAAAWHGVAALRRPAGASSASLDARGGARPTLRSERRPGRAAALRDGYCVAWDIVSDAALRCARYCVA